MTFEYVTAKMNENKAKLKKLGVSSLAVFGSVSRGEAQADSDVDLLVEFEGSATFDRYMDLKFLLEDLLCCRVDLATKSSIRPSIQSHIEQDLRRVA